MAEILIKAVDATHPDPVKDRRACHKKGDPVEIREDGAEWCAYECLPKFYVFKLPGVSVEQAGKYIEPHMEPVVKAQAWLLERYQEALLAGSYGDFISPPTMLGQRLDGGDVVVDLEGPVMEVITCRKYNFPFWSKVPATALDAISKTAWKVVDIDPADIKVKT